MKTVLILAIIACVFITAPAFAQEVANETLRGAGCNGGLMDTIIDFFDNFSWPWIV